MKPTQQKVLQIDKISKLYRLGKIGTGTLSGDLKRQMSLWRGDNDPAIPVDYDDRTIAGEKEVWALRNVDIDIFKGEVVGLIGKNGAGKSTLLKLLSRVTSPTTGSIKAKGRIASLLEVGTGMHPELTGRENIFLNGAVLGMSRDEIERKFDEIVEFSGCATYIDTPVKRYSSGMKVRLGFSVAAFLEPEILIVDEVLAVGDAEFQKKAVARMKEISGGGDRTVIFVSHNMTSIRSLCTRSILLEGGRVAFDGDVAGCIAEYLGYDVETTASSFSWAKQDAPKSDEVRMVSARVVSPGKAYGMPFAIDRELCFEVEVERLNPDSIVDCTLRILTDGGEFLAASSTLYFSEQEDEQPPSGNLLKFTCCIPADFFNQGVYRFGIYLLADRRRTTLRLDDLFRLTLTTAERDTDGWLGTPGSMLLPRFHWRTESL
ncbi:MAG: ABC transporter ATP-binding protein [Flavobacteriales bacterium]|nr:ABC transporter ATP-binding protein [Flavobacteriales bacterium]